MTCVSAFFFLAAYLSFWFYFLGVADYPILFWIVQIIGCKEIKLFDYLYNLFVFLGCNFNLFFEIFSVFFLNVFDDVR